MPENDDFANAPISEADYEEWKAAAEVRKRRIWAAPMVRQHIEKLRDVGADADKILISLDLIASDNTPYFRVLLAKTEQKIGALADKLEQVSTEAQAVLKNPFYSSDFNNWFLMPWEYEPIGSLGDLETRAENARKRIGPILELLRAETAAIRSLRRNYPIMMRARMLQSLLRYVKESTGEYHDDWVADLLQAAHDELEANATFSAEKLRKFRQRKMPDLIRTRKRSVEP